MIHGAVSSVTERKEKEESDTVHPCEWGDVTDLGRGHKDSPEHVGSTQPPGGELFLRPLLELKHRQRWTEEVGEMVEEDEPVTQRCYGDAGQLTVLHGHVGRQASGVDRLAGWPRETVGRPTCHTIDLLPCHSETLSDIYRHHYTNLSNIYMTAFIINSIRKFHQSELLRTDTTCVIAPCVNICLSQSRSLKC